MTTTIPCQSDPDTFFDPESMEASAASCLDCPIFTQCADMGRGEEYGVWAGEIKPGSLIEVGRLREAEGSPIIRRIVALQAQGMDVADIADMLNVTAKHVGDQLTRHLGSQRTQRREQTQQRVAELFDQGMDRMTIAETLGINKRTVDRYRATVNAERAIEAEAASRPVGAAHAA